MAYVPITCADIITQVKLEARIEGSDNLDAMILSLINELLLQEVNNHRYGEMLRLNTSLPLTDAQETYGLPANFANERLVRYKYENGYAITLNPRTEYVKERVNGSPKFYDIANGQISIFPYGQVLAVDELLLDYYIYPSTIVNDVTPFPIVRLINPIKQKIIARLHIYNKDLQSAQFHAAESGASTRQVQTVVQ